MTGLTRSMKSRLTCVLLALILVILPFASPTASAQDASDWDTEDRSGVVYPTEYGVGNPVPVTQEMIDVHIAQIGTMAPMSSASLDAEIASLRCWTKTVYFGDSRFDHAVTVNWCGSASGRISNVTGTGWVVGTAWHIQAVGEIATTVSLEYHQGIPQGATVFHQFQYCTGWSITGCISNFYPWLRVTVWSNGNISWTTGGF